MDSNPYARWLPSSPLQYPPYVPGRSGNMTEQEYRNFWERNEGFRGLLEATARYPQRRTPSPDLRPAHPGGNRSVIPDLREFGTFSWVPYTGSASHTSSERPMYAPARAYGPPLNHPYGPRDLLIPPVGPSLPPGGGGMSYGGWMGPSGSRHPMQPPPMYGPPPRPPSPASHYPFANHAASFHNRNYYGQRSRPSNPEDETPPPPYSPAMASQADSTTSDPLIHPALGWWPDQHRPALYWDLSSSAPPHYTRRQFDADELAASPFTPPLSRMRLVLDPHAQWAFDITASSGQQNITLLSLLKQISKLMRAPNKVPHRYWTRASSNKKEEILKAMLRRTGRTIPVQPPHRPPKSRGQIMEEAVLHGAPDGYTNLLVIDLLCKNVMFAGLEFHKGPDEWILRTTGRDS